MGDNTFTSFEEIANTYGNAGRIYFRNVSSGQSVSFPAFVTSFNDNYTVAFGGETVFGRNDPVKHYQSTSRAIQIALDIVGPDEKTAINNFHKYTQLIQMLYPVYSTKIKGANDARTIKAPPLWRIRYSNYIKGRNPHGLLGVVSGLSFTPKFDSGHHLDSVGNLIPMVYNMNFNFQPLHESPLGTEYGGTGAFLTEGFPYGLKGKADDASSALALGSTT